MVRSNTPAARAFLLILLLWAAANALSYFFRSDEWGNLLGLSPQSGQAIGVPWVIWSESGSSGFYSRLALLGNATVALLTAAMAHMLVAKFLRHRQDDMLAPGNACLEMTESSPGRALQFRIRTLLALFVVEAIILGGVRSLGDARPALLAAIYLLGPSLMLAVGWRLRDVNRTHRNLALLIAGFLFVPAAAVLGESIEGIHDFTRGLLGLFVCWVPQCVLLAAVLMAFRGRFALADPADGIDNSP